jgi:carotenoid 1,2-hydratase
VFSPYYARARRAGPADPENHVALNVALYGTAHRRWAMTERGRAALARDAQTLRIGRSRVTCAGGDTLFEIDEIGAPLPRRVAGTVRIGPEMPAGPRFGLDPAGRHRWQALAPRARIEVALRHPDLRWSGPGYLDTNDGDVPLEADFRSWEWGRAATRAGASVLYDVLMRDGRRSSLAWRFGPDGAQAFEPPPTFDAPATGLWRIPRPARSDRSGIMTTIEDTPFYARSTLRAVWGGEPVEAMHESLRLDRFTTPIVQAMLPFRMPRRRS